MEVTYTFHSMDNVKYFISPLMIEGNYEIRIRTEFKDFPVENSIDCFKVTVKNLDDVKGTIDDE